MNQQTKHRAGVATGWQRIEDEDGKAQYLPVPAEQRRRPALVGDVLPPMDTGARPPVMTVQTVTTSHTDRAKGFTITSIPLALAVGFVAFLAAIGLAGVPWMSWSALLILFGVFAAVWAGAYFWHTLASPDGATILSILLSYRYVRHEQRARLDRLAEWEVDDDADR
jgi:hypothetical protein